MDKTLKEMEGGVDYREVKQGRTPWLLSYYGPKILGSLALAVVSLSIAAALLASYKKGYITNSMARFACWFDTAILIYSCCSYRSYSHRLSKHAQHNQYERRNRCHGLIV
jgi:hypothetical protein